MAVPGSRRWSRSPSRCLRSMALMASIRISSNCRRRHNLSLRTDRDKRAHSNVGHLCGDLAFEKCK